MTPGVTTSLWKDTLNTTRYLRRNQCQSIRSYKLDLRMDPVQRSLCTLTPIVCALFCSWPCVPTPKICSDIWDCVESYVVHMFLAHRLKITFTSNLELIISFSVLDIVLLSLFKSLILVDLLEMLHLTSRV